MGVGCTWWRSGSRSGNGKERWRAVWPNTSRSKSGEPGLRSLAAAELWAPFPAIGMFCANINVINVGTARLGPLGDRSMEHMWRSVAQTGTPLFHRIPPAMMAAMLPHALPFVLGPKTCNVSFCPDRGLLDKNCFGIRVK